MAINASALGGYWGANRTQNIYILKSTNTTLVPYNCEKLWPSIFKLQVAIQLETE